jgi:putative endopeptidase
MKNTVVVITLLSIVSACSLFNKSNRESDDVNEQGKTSININYLDQDVRPQDDFFMFANGTWIKNNPVPEQESRWSSFNELEESNNKKLTQILEKASLNCEDAPQGSTTFLLGNYYRAYMNEDIRNEGYDEILKSIADFMDKIDSKSKLPSIVSRLHLKGVSALFNIYVGQDLKDINTHRLYVSQGGLGLPNRDYYDDPTKEEERAAYTNYLSQLAEVLGFGGKSPEIARKTVKFEAELAMNMMKPAELRSPENTYNPYDRRKFLELNQSFDFNIYFNALGIESFDKIIVGQPKYFDQLNKIIEDQSLDVIKSYLALSMFRHYAPHLNDAMYKAHFEMYGKALSGKKAMKPKIERLISELTGNALRHELGKAFVQEHFSEDAKIKVNEMVDNLTVVYKQRIQNLEWMSEETKKEALVKLEAIKRKLGFSDKFDDVSSIAITSKSHVNNVDWCNNFSVKKNLSKLNEPIDPDEWGMPAHMVNAYYHPLKNEIAFPAGIMQAPFFDINAEDAINYGGIGMVIGHEFTHGFDDMGSKFAADGSFSNWWQEEDRKRFEERTMKLGKTFEKFCPVDGHCVNPDLTMGENIADLGGITMAYHAYAMTDEFKSGKIVNGFTPSQRFFLAYAQLWKVNYTKEELKKRLATDPHSPGMYRVNGPLMNCPEFFEAFSVEESDPMRNSAEEISRIW